MKPAVIVEGDTIVGIYRFSDDKFSYEGDNPAVRETLEDIENFQQIEVPDKTLEGPVGEVWNSATARQKLAQANRILQAFDARLIEHNEEEPVFEAEGDIDLPKVLKGSKSYPNDPPRKAEELVNVVTDDGTETLQKAESGALIYPEEMNRNHVEEFVKSLPSDYDRHVTKRGYGWHKLEGTAEAGDVVNVLDPTDSSPTVGVVKNVDLVEHEVTTPECTLSVSVEAVTHEYDPEKDEEPDVEKVSMWSEYEGPQGGTGYKHMITGEVRYQENEPEGDDDFQPHGREVDVSQNPGMSNYGGISDASHIRDHTPVTAKFTDKEGETRYGQIEEVDAGGFREEFVIAAANGRRYHVEGDDIEGYIEPDPQWQPEKDDEHRMFEQRFQNVKDDLNRVPEVPVRDMGTGLNQDVSINDLQHIGDGKIGQKQVTELQSAIETGDLGVMSVDFTAVDENVDAEKWNTNVIPYHSGGQFAYTTTEMPVEDFLATQVEMLSSSRDHPLKAHRTFYGSADTEKVQEYAEVLESEESNMDMPFIELGQNGNLRAHQEGRHRALAALEAGMDTMPVRMVITAQKSGMSNEKVTQWELQQKSTEPAEWVPYLGPDGGEGWERQGDDTVRYQQKPPGKTPEHISEDYWLDEDDNVDEGSMTVEETLEVFENIHSGVFEDEEDTNDFRSLYDAASSLVQQRDADPEVVKRALLEREHDIEPDELSSEGKNLASKIGAHVTGHTKYGVNMPYITSREVSGNFVRNQAQKEFESDISWGAHIPEIVEDGISEWRMSMFEEETAPMFQVASDIMDNDTLPEGGAHGDDEYVPTVLEEPVGHDEKEAFRAKMEQTQDLLRDAFGESITVYRGLSTAEGAPTSAGETDVAAQLTQAANEGRLVEHEHRPVEAWSTNPEYASMYATGEAQLASGEPDTEGVLLKKEIPVDRVMLSSHTSDLSEAESEVIVMHEEVEEYSPDQIVPKDQIDNEKLIDEALQIADDTEALETVKKSSEPIRIEAEEFDPHWLHRDPPGDDQFRKDWVPYKGPFGGEGWQNPQSGEVRYTDDPPGEVETTEQTQTALPGSNFDVPVDMPNPEWIDSYRDIKPLIDTDTYEEIYDYFARGDYDSNLDDFIEAAEDYVTENGDIDVAIELSEALSNWTGDNPWSGSEISDDVPLWADPTEMEDLTPLWETGEATGISADSMAVMENKHFNDVYMTNLNPALEPAGFDAEDDMSAIRAVSGEEFMKELGMEVPNHYHEEGQFFAVEEVEGPPMSVLGHHRAKPSNDQYDRFAASQILMGNVDAHSDNVLYGFDGLQPIDLDLAGHDMSDGDTHRAISKLYNSAVRAGIYPPTDQGKENFYLNLQESMRSFVEFEDVEQAASNVTNDKIRQNIMANIDAAKREELIPEYSDKAMVGAI